MKNDTQERRNHFIGLQAAACMPGGHWKTLHAVQDKKGNWQPIPNRKERRTAMSLQRRAWRRLAAAAGGAQ